MKNKNLQAVISEDTKQMLKDYAKNNGLKLSYLVDMILKKFLLKNK